MHIEDSTLYIVRVYEGGESYDYEYLAYNHAEEHYKMEIEKGNKANLIAYHWDNIKMKRSYELIC